MVSNIYSFQHLSVQLFLGQIPFGFELLIRQNKLIENVLLSFARDIFTHFQPLAFFSVFTRSVYSPFAPCFSHSLSLSLADAPINLPLAFPPHSCLMKPQRPAKKESPCCDGLNHNELIWRNVAEVSLCCCDRQPFNRGVSTTGGLSTRQPAVSFSSSRFKASRPLLSHQFSSI